VPVPVEVTTDRALVYPWIVEDFEPSARRVIVQHANNRVEAAHGRIKSRLRPRRGLKQTRSVARSQPDLPSCRTCAAATTQ